MSVTISAELIDFKTKISSELSSMKTTSENLKQKIQSATNLVTSTRDGIGSVYSSKNKQEVLSKFDKINSIYSKVSSSIASFLDVALEKAGKLVEKVKKLEELKKNIDDQETKIKNAGSAWSYEYDSNNRIKNKSEVDRHNREREAIINEANSQLNILVPQFNELHEQAKEELNNLKSMDGSLAFVSEFKTVDVSNVSNIVNSNFEKYKFTASNGKSIEYYMYVPEYSSEVSKLPVHMYLHGVGEKNGKVLHQSLPKMLNEGLKTNGIIICPQINKGESWLHEDVEDALIELTNNVVETYDADSNRISLSGHSAGGIGGYKLIARYPDYFSAYIPISGSANTSTKYVENAWDSLSKVKIWAFHGKKDDTIPYHCATDAVEKLQSIGHDNMDIQSFNAGHDIQNITFEDEYSFQGGEKVNPLIWALSQTKES